MKVLMKTMLENGVLLTLERTDNPKRPYKVQSTTSAAYWGISLGDAFRFFKRYI